MSLFQVFSGSIIWKTISASFLSLYLPLQIMAQSATFADFEEVQLEAQGETFNTFFSIAQDHEGYLWFGTNNGLVRYDGYESKVYRNDTNDSSTIGGDQLLDLGDNPILLLYVDSQGDLWAGTTNDLSRYDRDGDRFTHYHLPVAKGRINAITEDKYNNLWVGGNGAGLFKYDREIDQFIPYFDDAEDPNSLINDFVNTLLTDQSGNIWIGLWNQDVTAGGLIRFNPDTRSVKRFQHEPNSVHSLIDNRISAILEDQDGEIWVGTVQNGLHRYNEKSGKFIRILPDPSQPNNLQPPSSIYKDETQSWVVNILHQNHNGNYWVGSVDMGLNPNDPIKAQTVDATVYHITGIGLNQFDPVRGRMNNYDLTATRKVPTVLFEDRQGQLWLGYQRSGGLFKLDNYTRKFKRYPELKGIQRSCESVLNPGVFWISTLNDGLHRLDSKSGTITNFQHDEKNEESIGHNSVRATCEDRDGILWIGLGAGGNYGGETGKGGLDRFDPKTGIFKHYKVRRDDTSNFSLTIYDMAEDDNGFLWIGTGEETLLRFDKNKEKFKKYHFPTATKGSKVWLLAENGVKFFGANDFTHRVSYQYDIERDTFISIFEGYQVNAVVEDEKGSFWLANMGQGLVHYNPLDGSKEDFTTKDGLINDLVVGIIAGDSGTYWLSTRVGLSKFDSKTKEFTSDGLPQDHFHICNTKASDGQFLFGGNNSLYAFYPNEVNGNPFAPNTIISGLQIAGEPYDLDRAKIKNINLSYYQNDLSFKYIGIHNSKPSKNKYQYKLIPYDNHWIDAGYQRIARYASLDPGSYTFQVKAASSDGIWNNKAASMSFEISPPWFQTWWAYSLMSLLSIGIIYSLFRFQLSRRLDQQEAHRLKELDTFKTRFYSNITHEFRTPLTVIQGMANELDQNPDEKPKTKINLIKKNSSRLLTLVNQMLDLSKLQAGKVNLDVQQDDIIIFIKYLVETHESFAKLQNVGLQFYSDEKELLMDFDSKIVEQILTNLISNAVKFTPEYGKILVVAKKINQDHKPQLQILVRDNGIGISKEQLPYIFDRFHQANPVHENQGTGIGLALVKELMATMNGSISVESELNKGTTFFLDFPIQNKMPLVSQTGIHEFKSINPPQDFAAQKMIVDNHELPILLIIEDNEDVTYYLQTCLRDEYQIQTSRNGREGIEKAFETLPDIVISDVMMPKMDGFEVCKILKEDERTSHIPIVLLTAKATSEDKLIGLTHGADAYLIKPFEKVELMIRLDKLLQIRKTLQIKYSSTLMSNQRHVVSIENKEDSFVQKVEQIILNRLEEEDFSILDLARLLHLSRSQVHRKIKALTGMSTAIYIRHIRLQKAKELLSSSELGIAEIAYQVGFKTPVYFSQKFKETFGQSPSATRK